MTTQKKDGGSGNETPAPRLTSFTDTLRTEGLGWVLRRLRYRTPLTATGRSMHQGLRRLIGLMLKVPRTSRRLMLKVPIADPDTLYAFYDLQVAPLTYDISWFAAAADLARRRKKLKRIHFVIVPGVKDGLREERRAYESVVDAPSRLWRLHNIVVPMLTLVPSFCGLTIIPSRTSAGDLRGTAGDRVYPSAYEPSLPVAHWPSELLKDTTDHDGEIGILRSPAQALRYIERWSRPRLHDRRLITVTIRDYDFMPTRNSNLEAWASFARGLDPQKYVPVFVLDTERTLDPVPRLLEGFEIFREASWNIALRMALYESSYLNLGVNNGPMFMCLLNARVRVLIFKILTKDVPQASEELMIALGFTMREQVRFATPFQRLVWENDERGTIDKEFAGLAAQIDHSL